MPNIVRMKNSGTKTVTNRLKNEKTVHNGVIKEDLEPCGVFMFMGDDVGIPYVPTHTVYDWEGYQRYGGQ